MRHCRLRYGWYFALLLIVCAPHALFAANGDDESDEFEPDQYFFLSPTLVYTPASIGMGERGRLFDGRGQGLQAALVFTGDRGPGDADILIDAAYAQGGGDRWQTLSVGARWVPLVRIHVTPFLGVGLSHQWMQLSSDRPPPSACCGRHDHSWGAYASFGFTYERVYIETRWLYAADLFRRKATMWTISAGYGF